MSMSQAIFAAGCFWGIQAVMDTIPGVLSTTVGYTGGQSINPSYQQVSQGDTNHAEAIKIVYDDSMVSYEQLLDIFFTNHNPTTLNRQGPDIGTQYRSVIFYLSPEQQQAATAKIEEMNLSGAYKSPIVTRVVPAGQFYPAEDYHQKYLARKGGSCHVQASTPKQVNDKEWQQKLSPEQYTILRQKGTEKPFSGKYLNIKDDGTFTCGACGNPIFASNAKFDSGSGWPSFDSAIPESVKLTPDNSHNMTRTEVTCARCGSHLGHVFTDGTTDTGTRFCINSGAMDFKKKISN